MTSTRSDELAGGLAGRLGGDENHQKVKEILISKGNLSISGFPEAGRDPGLAWAGQGRGGSFFWSIHFLLV